MATQLPGQYLFHISKEVIVKASAATVFEAMLEQNGPACDMPNGSPMPMKLEPWPGGRWFRDLGNNTGHFWGHVQVIKPPTLLEITGPMFMSYPVMSHLQFRIAEEGGVSKLTLTHRAIGDIADEHRKGVSMGWEHRVSRIKAMAER